MKAKELVLYPAILAWCALIFVLIGLGRNNSAFFIAASLCISSAVFVVVRILILHRREKKRAHKF